MNEAESVCRFHFDCPRCGERCGIGADQRARSIVCGSCGLALLGPVFRTVPGNSISRHSAPSYPCACPHCDQVQSFCEDLIAATTTCDSCSRVFVPPPAPWARWHRPVARIFTRRDCSYSLHHLLMDVRTKTYPDVLLSRRARRNFEFYCGACGHLQTARVWDIASQTPCRICNTLMIVPSPRHDRRLSPPPPSGDVLYCPQCGSPAAQSDIDRRRNSFCDRCAVWF